ncbi:glycoside hydrolase N-terminal domain-containing protein [Pelagicoccus sp. SDUM812005]|uniref:glycosyl hydrolase family 95 catalytic domain-containing protein n=1 Tax=Pelagicoccus sp. SDUM812005 TaxID=3041257 RepID=UPI00280CF5F6|nr:glycoside hydrolase N-terminal domain-containing protein [Pelagicoccus sp. SDUM812005]MDQ8182923.1 glycoside hydrolase N-terminal domain-containing protein [Pelagicoccus sp. SDUM812005]
MKYPAAWFGEKWKEALPSGNGVIGAAAYGAVHNETVLLTHDDLWHEVVTNPLPDVSDKLPETRRLLQENKAFEADTVLSQALKDAGYHADIGAPLPLGDLQVAMPVEKGFTHYRRALDMETGEVFVNWTDAKTNYQRKLFVSRAQDIVVMEISCDGEKSLDARIGLDLHDRSDTRLGDGNDPKLPGDLEIQASEDGIIRYAARNNDDQLDFGAVAKVISPDGSLTVTDNSIQVTGGRKALVVVKLFIKGERQSDWKAATAELESLDSDYDALLAPHVALHSELFKRVQIDLGARDAERSLSNEELLLDAYQGEVPTAMVEKMWAYGRYLLISSSREGGQPCPLQGKWCGSYRGYWTFNMANENLQMNYWQAMSGNLTETALPVFDYFERHLDDARENARKLYGCRGILISCITTPPSGLFKDIQPHILHWTGAAAWIGQHYYDYYLHTGDQQFLKERALPFLQEVAQFYEDFFTIGDDGYFLSAPSNSPENNPGNHTRNATELLAMETTMNATMDFALAKEVLTHLIEGSQLLGINEKEVANWKAMLAKIPPYQINEDGAIKEWMHPFYTDNYHHRHQSHIYPVFPGIEVTRENDPELYKAFEIAIRKRLDIGIGSQTGWSLAHMANVYARMGEGDQALDVLSLLARSCVMGNFYTTHNDWRNSGIGVEFDPAPYQIDANFGWTAAIQEMLLFSKPGQISILPALPAEWKAGSVSKLLARGGIEVSIVWNAGKVEVELLSKTEQSIELICRGTKKTLALNEGTPIQISF